MGHVCLSHHIAIYACPIPRDSHYNINMEHTASGLQFVSNIRPAGYNSIKIIKFMKV